MPTKRHLKKKYVAPPPPELSTPQVQINYIKNLISEKLLGEYALPMTEAFATKLNNLRAKLNET